MDVLFSNHVNFFQSPPVRPSCSPVATSTDPATTQRRRHVGEWGLRGACGQFDIRPNPDGHSPAGRETGRGSAALQARPGRQN
jgi:hypothetical protein